jgi:hypothetical protein
VKKVEENTDVSTVPTETTESAEDPAMCYQLLVNRLVEYFNKTGRNEVPGKGLELSVVTGLSSWTVRKALKYAAYVANRPFAKVITKEDAIQRANSLK